MALAPTLSQGTSRYASMDWLREFARLNKETGSRARSPSPLAGGPTARGAARVAAHAAALRLGAGRSSGAAFGA